MKFIILIVAIIIIFIVFQILLAKFFINKKFTSFEKKLMQKYYESLESTYKKMRGWRHDYHNHIQVMQAYLELKQYDKLKIYLNNLSEDITNVDTVIKTGNMLTDAILNTKIAIANSKNIKLTVKAIIPHNIPLTDLELCVIIGNLFDNAIEGCETLKTSDKNKAETEKFIRIYIDKFKDNFYISFTNSCLGKRKKSFGKFLTTKLGKNHGFGSERVNLIAKKYSAFVNRQSEDNVFGVELMFSINE